MARRADDLLPPLVDLIDDGVTDDQVASAVAVWLAEVVEAPAIELSVSAADELNEAWRAGDV